ncbi:MAG: hypothetical protein HY240_05890 [Actinobacteria bacterium]|nr:hypothetical protein [Actinomycetota bacterium]
MDREEMLARERSGWEALMSAVDRVAEDRRDEEGVVPGWSTRDLLWHCVYWTRYCAEILESVSSGAWHDPFADHDDAYWDEINQAVAAEAKTLTWDQVMAQAVPIRERVRAALPGAPERVEPGQWFAEETFEHYDEHAEQFRRFAGG